MWIGHLTEPYAACVDPAARAAAEAGHREQQQLNGSMQSQTSRQTCEAQSGTTPAHGLDKLKHASGLDKLNCATAQEDMFSLKRHQNRTPQRWHDAAT